MSKPQNSVALWLFTCGGMVVVMMLIGAATRLTESGLSMVEWRPLIGGIPPLSEDEWERVFDLYRQTSEYRLQHAEMDLAAFKKIFWWEYIHRLWGRLISTHNLSRSAGTKVSTGAYGFPPRLAAVGEVLVPALASTLTSSNAKAGESEVAPAQMAARKNVRRSYDDGTRPLADGSVATMAAQAASKDSMVHCVWSEILNTYVRAYVCTFAG